MKSAREESEGLIVFDWDNFLNSALSRFGFNTYSMLTMMVLGFNAVANVISNVNKNDNNNNNNLNSNDIGSVQGTSQVNFEI